MNEAYINTPLINNEAFNRFELNINNQVAILEYHFDGHNYKLLHTEVPEALSGKGIAAALVEKVLLFIESKNNKIKVYCPYVASFIKRHPEWHKLEIV